MSRSGQFPGLSDDFHLTSSGIRTAGPGAQYGRKFGATVCRLVLAALPTFAYAGAADEKDNNLDEIVVTATRTPTLIRDEPLRVEAVPTEEIEENLTVQPGNLTSLLNELSGVRAQSSAPGLGGAGLRLRGMPTRHTLVLMDGLPSLGAEPDSFGLLQTPPLDLARVEVIKGATSALYGGAALGGVLNLVSQMPAAEPALLTNVSSRGARDLVGFLTAQGSSAWSGTLTAGAHDQSREDVSGAGWAEVVGYRRYTLRPRLWWNARQDHSLFLTAGVTNEDREGGTLPGRTLPNGTVFREQLHTQRLDVGTVSHQVLADGFALNGRLSYTRTHLDQVFGAQHIASAQTTAFAEEALSGRAQEHDWVLGLAWEHDALAVAAVPGVSYTNNVPGVFAQDEFAPSSWLKFAISARVDAHNTYGTFFSPRLSALMRRPESDWSVRASVGRGFAAPTPLVDEIEATGLGASLPLHELHAERAVTESIDAKWANGGWDVNASAFNSEIQDPLQVLSAPELKLNLGNAPGAWRAPGAEMLIRYMTGPLQVIGSWSYIDATEAEQSGLRQRVPLVPRFSAELGFIIESARRGRVGLEAGYTGEQALADDPYRTVSKPYYEVNALGEIRFGGLSIFLNAINLTNVRQTHFSPLIRPAAGPGGNPITEVWAPLAGRTLNLGIRFEL
jgi:outer membrane receptor for ferrienterochelin and colicins